MINPSLNDVAKGDKFIGGHVGTMKNGFAYESVVLDVEDIRKRFSKDDRIVTVCVRSINLDGTVRRIIDGKKLIWWSDLNKGLV